MYFMFYFCNCVCPSPMYRCTNDSDRFCLCMFRCICAYMYMARGPKYVAEANTLLYCKDFILSGTHALTQTYATTCLSFKETRLAHRYLTCSLRGHRASCVSPQPQTIYYNVVSYKIRPNHMISYHHYMS